MSPAMPRAGGAEVRAHAICSPSAGSREGPGALAVQTAIGASATRAGRFPWYSILVLDSGEGFVLPEGKVQEIRRLLLQGRLSQRKIARLTETSRGTVAKIAQGKRPDYAARRRQHLAEDWQAHGPIGRCPACGARVYLPCRACKVASMTACGRTNMGERIARLV